LTTAVAPDLELPDKDGNPFKLSSLHGRKVLLIAWASW
jgi:peroxiredoxin